MSAVTLVRLDKLTRVQLEAAISLGEGTEARVLDINGHKIMRSTPIALLNSGDMAGSATAHIPGGGWICSLPLQVQYEVVVEDRINMDDGRLYATLYVEVTDRGIEAKF